MIAQFLTPRGSFSTYFQLQIQLQVFAIQDILFFVK